MAALFKQSIDILTKTKHFIIVNKPPLCYSQPPDTSYVTEEMLINGFNPDDTVLNLLQRSYPDLFKQQDSKTKNQLDQQFAGPKTVQRLDYNVSGAMTLATSNQAATMFSRNLKYGGSKGWSIHKYYAALLTKEPSFRNSHIHMAEDVHAHDGKLIMKSGVINRNVDKKPAFTKFWTLPPSDKTPYHLMLFSPLTGRKHQIRIHASQVLKAPILGDTVYTLKNKNPSKDSLNIDGINGSVIALHSYKIEVNVGKTIHEAKAPFWRNFPEWEHFMNMETRLLPDYLYTDIKVNDDETRMVRNS